MSDFPSANHPPRTPIAAVTKRLVFYFSGFDPRGEPIEREASGFHARVVQHECDHLIGVLYPMRIRDFRHFGYTEALFPDQVNSGDE